MKSLKVAGEARLAQEREIKEAYSLEELTKEE